MHHSHHGSASHSYGHVDTLEPFDTGEHTHAHHQLLFAVQGTLRLTVGAHIWILPPARAAWIHSEVPHTVQSNVCVHLRTLYLASHLQGPKEPCSVFAMTPMGREMILYATQWTAHNASTPNPLRSSFFQTIAHLCARWTRDAVPIRMPRPSSPELARAMHFALEHLSEPISLHDAAHAAHISPRTLTRRFQLEAHTTWRRFLHTARMIRAMELLSDPNSSVTNTALDVGFSSIGAFSHAFRTFTGQTPTQYRTTHTLTATHDTTP